MNLTESFRSKFSTFSSKFNWNVVTPTNLYSKKTELGEIEGEEVL